MHVLWTHSRLEGAFWIRGCFLSPPTLFRGFLLLFCIQSKSMVSFLKPTVSPPLRATTVPMHLPSCILGSPPEGGSGLGGTRGSHRAWGPLGRPLPPCTGRAGVQSQRAGARLRAGMLAPAEGGQGLPRRAWPGVKRGDEEEAGAFCWEGRSGPAPARALLPSPRGGNGSVCSALPAKAGGEGKRREGRGWQHAGNRIKITSGTADRGWAGEGGEGFWSLDKQSFTTGNSGGRSLMPRSGHTSWCPWCGRSRGQLGERPLPRVKPNFNFNAAAPRCPPFCQYVCVYGVYVCK